MLQTQKRKAYCWYKFSGKRKPTIENRAFQDKDELEKFRLKHKLIDPIKLSEIVRTRIASTKNDQLMLEGESQITLLKVNLIMEF